MLTRTELAQTLRYIAQLLCTDNEPGVVHPVEEPPAPKRRGRPAGSTNAAPPATEVASTEQTTTAASTTTPEPEKPAAPAVEKIEGALTHEELQALIRPIVMGNKEKGVKGQGLKVKEVINSYAPKDFAVSDSNSYTLALLAEHPEHHAAFAKDIEALSY